MGDGPYWEIVLGRPRYYRNLPGTRWMVRSWVANAVVVGGTLVALALLLAWIY